MLGIDALVSVLGCAPGQPELQSLLKQVRNDNSAANTEPEVKAYPDIVYHNYLTLGISLQYEPTPPNTNASKASPQDLRLAAIDVYSGREDKRWTCFPALPLKIEVLRSEAANESLNIDIVSDTTGKDLVTHLGEPQRKGGGAGDRSGPAAWMEWTMKPKSEESGKRGDFKLQIELAGAGARGADRWNAERAGVCPWAVVTIS